MSSAVQTAEAQRTRDAYMQHFSDTFSDELVQLYEQDGNVDAIQHLTALIENGVHIYGHPLTIAGNPLK